MKSLLPIFLLVFCVKNQINAQVDVIIKPLALAIGNPNLSVDIALKPKFSIGLFAGFGAYKNNDELKRHDEIPVMLNAKFYPFPKRGADRFYLNGFGRFVNRHYYPIKTGNSLDYTHNRVGAGVGIGYKYAGRKGLVFDIGFDAGHAIVDKFSFKNNATPTDEEDVVGLILLMKIGLGYRFGGKSEK
jgi:Protein of unknown function (DUF3575)